MTISKEQYALHLPWLFIGFAVPLLGFLMSVQNGDEVAFQGLTSFPLPQVCFSRRLFGISCPGCGLTRSIIYLMHGQFATSFAIHHMGWLIFLMIIAQIPYRIWCLWGDRRRLMLDKMTERILWGTVISLFLFNAVLRWF